MPEKFLRIDGNKIYFLRNDPEPSTWDLEVQTLNANETFSIEILGNSPNININWGDGNYENFTTTGVKSHSYSNAGTYTIKLDGQFSSSGNIRIGDPSKFSTVRRAEKQRLKNVGPIPEIIGLSSCENTFVDCSGLTSIPNDLFAYNPNITNFNLAFLRCSLTTIPSDLFSYNINATSFRYIFQQCPNLTNLNSDLFKNNTLATDFSGVFSNCTSLTEVPSNLFYYNTSVTNFQQVFGNCTSLTTIPSGIFDTNTSATNMSWMFVSCTSLTSIPEEIFRYNTNVTTFYLSFYNVTLNTTDYSRLINELLTYRDGRTGISFHGGSSKYDSSASSSRSTLVNTYNWIITDGGPV